MASYVDSLAARGGGGGTNYLWQQLTTYDNAEIIALSSTPAEVVPAPGANRVIIAPAVTGFGMGVIQMLAWGADFGNVNASAEFSVAQGTNAGYQRYGQASNVLKWGVGGPDRAFFLLNGVDRSGGGSSMNSLSDFVNQPLTFFIFNQGDGPITGGDPANELGVSLFYYVIDTTTGLLVPAP